MPAANPNPTHDWDGATGDNWVEHQMRLDRMLQPFGDAALSAANVQAGEHILDVGCGAGTTSFALSIAAGVRGRVVGVDISPQLIARAKADRKPDAPVAFELADAATAPWAADSFDLLFSRFGVTFFGDPVAAFTHMRCALKPGGRLTFVCWRGAQENDWVRLPMAAIRDLVVPPKTDPEAPGPFAFGDPARVERILLASGFTDAILSPLDASIPYGHGATHDDAVEDALRLSFAVGPLARALAGQPEDIRARAADAVRAAFAARPGGTSVLIDGAAWIVTAHNPAG